jgi:hypothetical protein
VRIFPAVCKAPQRPVIVNAALEWPAIREGQFDIVVLFMTRLSELQRRFQAMVNHLDPSGGFWVAWPKKASGVPTDITEDRVRNVALPAGLVDNKVCAIDETWSGLRCVIRRENRPSER